MHAAVLAAAAGRHTDTPRCWAVHSRRRVESMLAAGSPVVAGGVGGRRPRTQAALRTQQIAILITIIIIQCSSEDRVDL